MYRARPLDVMTSSQYIIRYIDNQPVCSDTLMYLSYVRLNLRKKMLHVCRMKYYNFSIIFEMSTNFSVKNLPTCAGKYVEN